jgi:hypothetical protein
MTTALVPLDQMQTMAKACAESGLFGAKTPQQALTIMLLAQAEGRHPMSAAADYDLIGTPERGYKPSKKAQAMLRDFLAGGGSVTWHKYADDGCDATFSHPQGGEVRVKWDKAKMQQAQIKNDAMYNKFPAAMYRSRCISEGVRTVYPMATGGLYVPEEIRAIQSEKNMGPAPVIEEAQTDDRPKVAAEQVEAIKAKLKDHGVEMAKLLAKAEIEDISELASEDAPGAIRWIEKHKK